MRKVLTIAMLLFAVTLFAQEDSSTVEEKSSKAELNGYISNMQSVQFEKFDGIWLNDNLIHNRLNFSWFPGENISFKVGLRNRLFTGESVKSNPNYGKDIKDTETGYLEFLCWNVINEPSVVLNMNIDRMFFQYEKGKFSASIGRQRINWGKTFVWNPNDIFNAYSFFDFDYAERPGSDAIRLQYYTSEVSSVEIAAKIDKNEDITAAAIWRFNLKEYDFQLMGGILNSSDYTLGAGWSGAIKGIDFKGEMSYFYPKNNFNDTTGMFIGSISFGYTFANSLNLLFEFLYMDIEDEALENFVDTYSGSLSVKKLTFTKYNLFGQVGYQLTPLLTGSLSAIYYPDVKGYFIGPSLDYSFTDNLYVSVVAQVFSVETENFLTNEKERFNYNLGFLRLKWNF